MPHCLGLSLFGSSFPATPLKFSRSHFDVGFSGRRHTTAPKPLSQ